MREFRYRGRTRRIKLIAPPMVTLPYIDDGGPLTTSTRSLIRDMLIPINALWLKTNAAGYHLPDTETEIQRYRLANAHRMLLVSQINHIHAGKVFIARYNMVGFNSSVGEHSPPNAHRRFMAQLFIPAGGNNHRFRHLTLNLGLQTNVQDYGYFIDARVVDDIRDTKMKASLTRSGTASSNPSRCGLWLCPLLNLLMISTTRKAQSGFGISNLPCKTKRFLRDRCCLPVTKKQNTATTAPSPSSLRDGKTQIYFHGNFPHYCIQLISIDL